MKWHPFGHLDTPTSSICRRMRHAVSKDIVFEIWTTSTGRGPTWTLWTVPAIADTLSSKVINNQFTGHLKLRWQISKTACPFSYSSCRLFRVSVQVSLLAFAVFSYLPLLFPLTRPATVRESAFSFSLSRSSDSPARFPQRLHWHRF